MSNTITISIDWIMLAKYNAMSMAAASQALGHPMTNDMIKTLYEASFKDLQKDGQIKEVADAYDDLMKIEQEKENERRNKIFKRGF